MSNASFIWLLGPAALSSASFGSGLR